MLKNFQISEHNFLLLLFFGSLSCSLPARQFQRLICWISAQEGKLVRNETDNEGILGQRLETFIGGFSNKQSGIGTFPE